MTKLNLPCNLIMTIDKHNISNNVSLYFQIYDEDSGSFSNFDLINPVVVTDESESITIGIGPLIQKYLFSETLYLPSQNRGIRIKVSDYSNNFNSLIIEESDSSKLPEIEIFYRYD